MDPLDELLLPLYSLLSTLLLYEAHLEAPSDERVDQLSRGLQTTKVLFVYQDGKRAGVDGREPVELEPHTIDDVESDTILAGHANTQLGKDEEALLWSDRRAMSRSDSNQPCLAPSAHHGVHRLAQ